MGGRRLGKTMIIPLRESYGDAIVMGHIGPNNKPPISVYRKDVHANGYYPVYRVVYIDRVKTYYNKTHNQIIGILKRMGY